MPAIRNILVPTDFSETSRAALRYAADLARQFDSRVHLLHVTPDPSQLPWAVGPGLAEYVESLEMRREKMIVALRAMATEEHLDPLRTSTRILEGVAHHEILEYVRSQGIDLVVMGTHGHGAFAHLLLGSVAERVVRHSPCPVLVLPRVWRPAVAAHASPEVERAPLPAT
jgi:nucleotide-binding universal stress UspA family protein